MLAIASLGPVPLWLHHEIQHAHGADSTLSTGCCASHCHAGSSFREDPGQGSEPRTSGAPVERLAPGEHDCWMCFTLAQAPSVGLVGTLNDHALFVVGVPTPSDVLFFAAVNCSHPPRGPPTV